MSDSSNRNKNSNSLDRIISYFSPSAGARRLAARSASRIGSEYYNGSRGSRLNYNWSTSQESADTSMDGEIQTVIDRSRDLNRNNSIASGLTGTMATNTVNTGIVPQSAIKYKEIGISEAKAKDVQEQIENSWKRFAPLAAANGKLTFSEIQSLAIRQIIEQGEFLSVRRALQPINGRKYMLALDVMEADRLETPFGGGIYQEAAKNIRFGVELGGFGQPKAYHIRKTHPGDSFSGDDRFKRIPAFDAQERPNVFHVFPTLRPGQTRGVPLFAPVIELFKTLGDYIEAELVKARVNACYCAFIKSDGYGSAVGRSDETVDDQRLESLEPGTIEYLGDNQDVVFSDPKNPGTTFDSFVERLLRMIGASLGMPYELVLKDFSKTNYSSARAALLQAYKVFAVWRQMIVNHLCQPVYELLVEEAFFRGEINAPNFEKYKWEYTRAVWIPPGNGWVDPKKEAEANVIADIAGYKSKAEICAENGKDWEAVAEQKAREKRKYDELGLDYNIQEGQQQDEQNEAANTEE